MIEIRCRKCGTWNTDGAYCRNCGAVISIEEEERLERIKKNEIEKNKPKDKFDVFIEKYKTHPNVFVRSIFYLFYSVYFIFMVIGSFFAWMTFWASA